MIGKGKTIGIGLCAAAFIVAASAVAGNPAPVTVPLPAASGADTLIGKLDFKQAKMVDVLRALSDVSGMNFVATTEAGGKDVTVFLQNIRVRDALDTITKNSGLWYRQDRNGSIFRVMTTEEYQKDMVVYREDTTRIFTLLHPNPVIVASAIRDIYGDRVRLSLGVQDSGLGTGSGDNPAMFGGAGAGGYGAGGYGAGGFGTANGVRQATSRQTGFGFNGGVLQAAQRTGESERVFREKLTPDQLQRIDELLTADSAAASTKATEALNQLSRNEQPIYITVNREHNLIIVRTTDPASVRDIEQLIQEMDRPTPQVLLEMKVLELSSGDSFKQIFSLSAGPIDGKSSIGVGNFPPEGGTLVYQFMNNAINARLELLERNNRINTLSTPLLLASNNKPAQVFVGEERVLVTGITASATAVTNGVVIPTTLVPVTEVRNIGNTLQILPKINADRSVTLNIVQDASSVNVGGGTLPVFVGSSGVQYFSIDTVSTSNIQGTVVARDGLTVAIGGLIRTVSGKNEQRVPGLAAIPGIGELFKRKEDVTTKTELLLLITPRIITNPSETETVARKTVHQIGGPAFPY